MISAAIVDTHRGEGDAGRRRLLEAERVAADPDEAGLLVLMRCFLAWLDERDDELGRAAASEGVVQRLRGGVACERRRARACRGPVCAARPLRRSGDALRASLVGIAARRGSAQSRDAGVLSSDDRLRARRARGRRGAARRLTELYQSRGHVLGVLVCNALRGATARLDGQAPAAAQLLDATACAHGAARVRYHRAAADACAGRGRRAPARCEASSARPARAIAEDGPAPARSRPFASPPRERIRPRAGSSPRTRRSSRDRVRCRARARSHLRRLVHGSPGASPTRFAQLERATAVLVDDGADPALVPSSSRRSEAFARSRCEGGSWFPPRARPSSRHCGCGCAHRPRFVRERGVVSLRKRPCSASCSSGSRAVRDAVVEGCARRAALGHELQAARPRQSAQGLGDAVALADRQRDVARLRRRWLPPRRPGPIPVPRRADK